MNYRNFRRNDFVYLCHAGKKMLSGQMFDCSNGTCAYLRTYVRTFAISLSVEKSKSKSKSKSKLLMKIEDMIYLDFRQCGSLTNHIGQLQQHSAPIRVYQLSKNERSFLIIRKGVASIVVIGEGHYSIMRVRQML